jgi:hypothetical protein
MIDQFSISSGGGQCPPLRGIDRLPSAAKTVSPAMTNKPDRATILIRMLYHGYPGSQHSISDIRNGLRLDRSPVSVFHPVRPVTHCIGPIVHGVTIFHPMTKPFQKFNLECGCDGSRELVLFHLWMRSGKRH